MFDEYEVVGEFGTSRFPEGVPNIIQCWVAKEDVEDPDPNNTSRRRWCVSLIDKRVELRRGDRIVVLRRKGE